MAVKTNWIDISRHNGVVSDTQWNDIRNKCEGVVFRIAYRGYSTGNIKIDPVFTQNYKRAKDFGLKISVYFFSQAINVNEAKEEADYVNSTIGMNGALRIFIDTEWANTSHTGRADLISVSTRTAVVKAFCDRIIALGGVPGIYASTDWFNNKLNMASLSKYKLWVADYRGYNGYDSVNTVMWQFSSKNAFGITGFGKNLDCNYNYEDFAGESIDTGNSGNTSTDNNTTSDSTASTAAGTKFVMNGETLYGSSTATTGVMKKNFTVYIYDGKVINNRLRVTTMASKCGAGMKYVSGWIDKSILKPKIYAGRKILLNNQMLYSSSTSAKGYTKYSYTCYIYDGKEYNGRYRVCKTSANVGKGIGYVVGWVEGSILE